MNIDPAVRRATVADAEQVAALLHDFNTEYDTPKPGVAVLTERLIERLASDSLVVLLVGMPSSGTPVGLAVLTFRPSVWYLGPVAVLDELYVVPLLRGQRLGSQLLAAAEQTVQDRGGELLEINVDGYDLDARRFYERHGYRNSEAGMDEPLLYYFRELGSTTG